MRDTCPCVRLVPLGWLLVTAVGSAQEPTDRAAAFLGDLEAKLGKHAFFCQVDFDKDDRHAPFVFYVQRPTKADPLYVRRIVNSQVPFLRKLMQVFEATYAQPLALQRHASAPVFAVAVLNSRGAYDEYGRATKAHGLRRARAHYEPSLQLAVTYEDVFAEDPAGANIDERHSLLHEMVHALQHAYSADGQMPTGLWFVEGLAEYRASCDHMPDKLDVPPLNEVTMRVLALAATRPELRHYLCELKDLLGARNYVDVVKHASARGRAARSNAPANDEFALGSFYAQASMFVRFLHEGEDARYRPSFMQCMAGMMRGKTSSAAWAAAFPDVDLGELERQFRVWLTDVIRERGQIAIADLAPRAPGNPIAAAAALPRTAFDPRTVAWRPEDAAFRLDAARQLCSGGDYEAALGILPGDGETTGQGATSPEGIARERARIEAVRALRDRVIADLVQSKGDVELEVDGKPSRVRLKSRAEARVVVATAKAESTVPVTSFRPAVLLAHCWRKRWLTDTEIWLDRWLRWLTGAPIEKVKPLLAGTDPKLVELRGELRETFADAPATRSLAGLLLGLQKGALPDAPTEARAHLNRLREAVRQHAAHPALVARRPALATAARALAERAFTVGDVSTLGLTGQVEALADHRFRVVYEGTGHRSFDLRADHAYLEKLPQQSVQIASSGGPTLRQTGTAVELLGEGFFRWALPLTGKVSIELHQSQAAGGQLQLVFCDDAEGSHLEADPFGLYVYDLRSQPPLVDHVGVVQRQFQPNRTYKLRVEHDGGNQARVELDGKELAPWRGVGTRSSGWLGVYVFTSNPILLHKVVIEGAMDAREIPAMRQRFVDEAVAEVEGRAPGSGR